MPSRSIIRTGVGPHREQGIASRPWRRRSISSPRERLAFSRDETSVDPSARSSITPTQSLDSIVRGRALILQLSLVASDSSYLWDDCVEVSHVGRLGKRPCLA